ncbi:hypothetical protein CCB80_08810 [Armatimonadetes bacterium Uphvl-Ar1]|nr:hypothetical protein CCB80_08810 [Armatimonadetes bacterium Uphvl-Ar1]
MMRLINLALALLIATHSISDISVPHGDFAAELQTVACDRILVVSSFAKSGLEQLLILLPSQELLSIESAYGARNTDQQVIQPNVRPAFVTQISEGITQRTTYG